MSGSSSTSSGGVGGLTILQIVFITLKLIGKITWPWWKVMLPTIIPLGFLAAIGFVALVVVASVKTGRKWSK